jgi:hypothetical protein
LDEIDADQAMLMLLGVHSIEQKSAETEGTPGAI